MQINEMSVGSTVTADLLVVSSTLRLTTTKKEYLDMVLSDGYDSISVKHWDWNRSSIPSKGSVVNITADVTEWQGKKQLTSKKLLKSEVGHESFAPKGTFDMEEYQAMLESLILDMKHEELGNIVSKVFYDFQKQWETAPAATGIHHAYVGGTLEHCVDTAMIAKAIATNLDNCDVDLCVAGALLHDVGKLLVYGFDTSVITYLEYGHMLEHIVGGITILEKYRTDDNSGTISLLQHIIASHHGEKEYGSPVTPKFLEAWVVSFADNIDAKANIIARLNRNCKDDFTSKEWALNNSQMMAQHRVDGLLHGTV